MVADIKSERWPASRRNGWPASVGIRIKDHAPPAVVAEGAVNAEQMGQRALRHTEAGLDLNAGVGNEVEVVDRDGGRDPKRT